MAKWWNSAQHCHYALESLLGHLENRSGMDEVVDHTRTSNSQLRADLADLPNNHTMFSENPRGTKRPRTQDDVPTASSPQQFSSDNRPDPQNAIAPSWPTWTPIFQYNGPDFGFDALQLGYQQTNSQSRSGFDFSNTGFFDDMGWTGYSFDPEHGSV